MDLATPASYLITHMLGHGYDLAVALRRPHTAVRHRTALAVPFLMAAPGRAPLRAAAPSW
ncbi:hypothetical protein [Kitasatospora sp. NBC_01246]|uniref:hypothetical protein n=1 Tax=Kitasatospora sp. NBC_01246 TaxID=2903570 RepID=UPI002E3031D6|nr:hypothetical protein [Kitasatospora sp. NBC_01246]